MNRTPSDTLYVGADLGGSKLKVALVDSEGSIVAHNSTPTEAKDGPTLIEHIVGGLKQMMASAGAGQVKAIGVGLPGLINRQTNKVEILPNLPDAAEYDITGEIIKRLAPLPVVFDNDANMAAYGEFVIGAARGKRSVFFITLGTGIGAGIILDGEMWRGATGFAGEFGHMTINPEGLDCTCGSFGCLETVASAPNIVRRARERLFRDSTSSLSKLGLRRGEFTSEDIAKAAAQGDELAQLVLERTGMYLGVAIANVVNLLNVEMVVLGGGVMEAGNLLLKPTVEEVRRRAFRPAFAACQFVISELGTNSGTVGAAMRARDALNK
ncbi:MAG TPA: ROK family protein [Blastocatellia bacterium]|nr:ROK family protein [Blastocatellia bacterium]